MSLDNNSTEDYVSLLPYVPRSIRLFDLRVWSACSVTCSARDYSWSHVLMGCVHVPRYLEGKARLLYPEPEDVFPCDLIDADHCRPPSSYV